MATEDASASSSASESSEKIEAMKKASDLLAQGKRNIVCGEIPKAVNLYEEAVQLLVKACGELSRHCADAYFSCGSALLELGRMETSVLGAALEGVEVEEEKEEEPNEQFEKPSESEGEEREKLREEVYEAMAEGTREEEFKKTSLEKSKKSCAEGGMEVCDKSSEDQNVTSEVSEKEDKNEKESDGLTKHCAPVSEGGDPKDGLTVAVSDEVTPQKPNDDGTAEKTGCAEKGSVSINDSKEEKGGESGNSDKSEEKTSDDIDKQTDDGKIVTEACKDDFQNAEGKKSSNNCGSDLTLEGEVTDVESKGITRPDGANETESSSSAEQTKDESKATDECQDVEMADKDAADEVEEDAEEEEENIAEDKDGQEGDEVEGEEKEEDVPNFQLAWEYLDLAKVIYLKSESTEDQLKAAECHIKLGELSMETEQHATAAEDLESALKIQQKFLPADDRLLAETHYQLGLAYGLGKEFELSIQHYTEAISVIEAKIASLNKLVEAAAADEDNKENHESDQRKKYQDEIKELQELIPEMRNKIEDAREEAKVIEKMKEMAKEALGFSGPSKKFDSPTKRTESNAGDRIGDVDENGEKKATDIAHLVRKKRKPDNDTQASSEQEVKKIKHDISSGDSTSAPATTVNGSSEENVEGHIAEQNKCESTSAEPAAS